MQERVAIINTLDDYDSISVANLTYLTDKLRETAVNVLPSERFGIMTTESIVAFLGSLENTIRVCKESSCLAELGRQVSADYVAQGRIGRFNNDLTIKVELYSVVSGNLMGSFAGRSKDVAGLLDLIEEKSADLFKKMLTTTPPSTPVTPPPPPQQEPQQVQYQPSPPPPVTPPVKYVIKYDGNNISIQEYVQILIERDIKENKEEIQKLSFSLSSDEKGLLWKNNEKKWAVGLAVLNIYLGLGSYIQGNTIWGVTQSALQIGGYAVVLASYSYEILGGVMVGSALAIGLVAPFVYQSKYNKTLREALNIDESISLSIDPPNNPKRRNTSTWAGFQCEVLRA